MEADAMEKVKDSDDIDLAGLKTRKEVIKKMKIPHTVPRPTARLYTPDELTLSLGSEIGRKLKSEDTAWDEQVLPRLSDMVLQEMASAYKYRQVLSNLFPCNATTLLEVLPLDLPMSLAAPGIPDGIYWKRLAQERWQAGNYLQYEYQAAVCNYASGLDRYYALYQVRRIRLRELRRFIPFSLPEHSNDTDIPDPLYSDHLDLGIVLQELVNLKEFEVVFAKRNMGDKFDWAELRVAIADCERLGAAVARSTSLQTLRVRKSRLDGLRVAALVRPIAYAPPPTLTEVDLSHCPVGDDGALVVAKLITIHAELRVILLINAKIGGLGAKGLAYALTQCPSPGLDRLDLRLNPIGDAGGQFMAAAMARNYGPRDLGLAGCDIGELGGLHLSEAIHNNVRVQVLDVSSNVLGLHAGNAFAEAMSVNSSMLHLDIRSTGAAFEHEEFVQKATRHNRERHRSMWEQQQVLLDLEQERRDQDQQQQSSKQSRFDIDITRRSTTSYDYGTSSSLLPDGPSFAPEGVQNQFATLPDNPTGSSPHLSGNQVTQRVASGFVLPAASGDK